MLKRPKCLHVPELHEFEPATISWEADSDAAGYQLDCIYDDAFEVQTPGLSWENTTYYNYTWSEVHDKDHTWESFLLLPPVFILYDGPGVPCGGPDAGLTWGNLLHLNETWREWLEPQYTWESLIYLVPMGLDWMNIHHPGLTWGAFADQDLDWRTLMRTSPLGLIWEILLSFRMDWGEIHDADLSWYEFIRLNDRTPHLSHTHVIELKKKTAQYRLRAYGNSEFSDYITSVVYPIIPRFECEDILEWEVRAGEQYFVQLDGIAAQDDVLPEILMGVSYSPELVLENFCAQLPEVHVEPVELPDALLELVSHEDGKIGMRCIREVPKGLEWSGLITLFSFAAVADGVARVELSR